MVEFDENNNNNTNDDALLMKRSSSNGNAISSNGSSNNACSHNNNNSNSNNDNNCCSSIVQQLSRKFDNLNPAIQLTILASGVFLGFGANNILQEAIINIPRFHYGMMLGYLEVLGVAVCSYLERRYIANESGRAAPLNAYPMLTLCLLSSSSLGTLALNYINFPTKVVFRSCKLLPTMLIASLLNKRKNKFSIMEYACAFAISVGLILFAAADWSTAGPKFNPLGITFVSLSTCADALLPNAQEQLFTRYGSTRLEVTLYTNIFTLLAMTVTTYLSGDLLGLLHEIRNTNDTNTSNNNNNSGNLLYILIIYTFIAYIAISFHMNIVKRFGGVTAVLVSTARKGLTLILSFVLFPKAFSWFYVMGAILVLGGLLLSSLIKIKRRSNSNHSGHSIKRKNSNDEYLEEMRTLISNMNNTNNNNNNNNCSTKNMDNLDMLEMAVVDESGQQQQEPRNIINNNQENSPRRRGKRGGVQILATN